MNTDKTFPGYELKNRREELGFTPADVYRKLHIPEHYVTGLESASFEALPGATYTLGFLKTYCQFLGLEPEPYLQAYRDFTRPVPQGLLGRSAKASEPVLNLWQDIMTWVAVCGLILLGWVAYTVVVKPGTETEESQVKADTVEMVVPPLMMDK